MKFKLDEEKETDEKLNIFKEEKVVFPSENMKLIMEEIEAIKKEIVASRDISMKVSFY